jgi:hypothetical protein
MIGGALKRAYTLTVGQSSPNPEERSPNMATRNRQDAHRPAEMVSADYRYLASSYGFETEGENGPVREIEWDGTEEWFDMGRPTASTCAHAIVGQCDHCGAHHTYQTILLYIPTGELLSVGNTCAVERFGRQDWARCIADGKRRAELRFEREKKTSAALAAMNEATRAAFDWATTDENANRIAKDISGKVAQYGPLTERQAAFLCKLHAESLEKKTQVETGEVSPCPAGRVEIEGTIVGTKVVDDPYSRWGGSKTMLVIRDDRGFKVYGSLPSGLGCCFNELRGTRLRFAAAIEPSNDDPTFGFYKRPTKVENLSPREAEEEVDMSGVAAGSY